MTERSIFESLPAVIRGKTLFIVAHRLSTIKDCSRILLLDENRLLACGTHESLLRSSEYYRLLIEIHRAEIDRAPALPDREGDSFWLSPSAGLSAGLTDASLGMEERRRVGLSSAS